MSNQFPINCNRCGALLDPNQLAGLCPRCLAAQHFATDTAASDALASRHEPPPSLENIAASFPQLEAIEFLGRGGMGVVYRARQKSLGRTVALKLLAPERLGDPDFATRFEREAKALAALNHPNIVTVYDFGKADQFYYLLMEFVDGVNLRQAMSAGRFTPEQSLAIVPPVCEALQYAHEHGIVHRDIKPENLLLDKEGRVKIADFGIAKMLGTETSIADISELQPVGTPQYMAPEQKLHLKTDHRADIYSLGVVLYEMLTGELPTGQLQPPSRRIQIDVRIDQIVLKALEASPEMRFGTAAEFRSNVEAVTRQGAVSPTAPKASLPVSALALWGAAWAAMCLLSPSWPFIVVGLGLLTLLLVVLFDFLVVRAVWRRLNRSQTAEGGAANSWTWSIVVGGLLALVGGAILLGRPVINELVDDFGLTKSARAHHQTHERASQNWSDLTTAAAEAMIALEAAKKVEDAAEVERLTRESQLLREGATQAERALNQVALQKHASERERSNLLYLLGGGLIATGLLICFQDASRSRRPIAQHAVSSHLSGTATLMTPAELASIWNQFFCYRTRGPLMLDGDTLTHCYAGRTTSIPLQTIRDVSIGRLPRLMNLAGLSVLSITYEDDGEPRQVLISPIEGGYEFSQAAVSDWCASIRQAVVGATGRKPTTTPPEQLGIPRTSKMMTKYK